MPLVSAVTLTSDLADLGRVYPWLEDAAADKPLPEGLLTRMHVALEEAVANIAMHGFDPGRLGQITLRLHEIPGALVIEIDDNGAPFDPTAAPKRIDAGNLAEVRIGGRGLTLIRGCCEDVRYERRDAMNHLTMRFSAG